MAILRVENLQAGYQDVVVINDVSLSVASGELVVLMGPNGAGKSTLLKAIAGLVPTRAGSIFLDATPLTHLPTYQRARKGISFVPQGRINFDLLTVDENLRIGLLQKTNAPSQLERVRKLFPVLAEKRHRYAYTLSGGEQQMLAMARAIVAQPTFLLLDEPSLGLSPKLVQETFLAIAGIRREYGIGVLVVEHNIRSVLDIANRGVILVQGAVLSDAPVAELLHSEVLTKVFVGTFD